MILNLKFLFLPLILASASAIGVKLTNSRGGLRTVAVVHPARKLQNTCSNTDSPCTLDGDCAANTCLSGSTPGIDCSTNGDEDCLDGFRCMGGANDGLSCDDISDCPSGGGTCLNDQTPCVSDGDCGAMCSGGSDDGEPCSDTANSSDCPSSGICEGGAKDGDSCTTDNENL
eukprot:CAMPEP_0201896342 /NCGR_PEP_ID=MMETSP0902-20130614/44421_1 /ASSEMBLY_ACC=CAM_ASM_000551 /TAXON_ID=420261 /ORGANISM="Thalassiosira antarctica, Strain CCMP982" /LENGTH=171 /DNA_ID=CAMNT_0048428907 /DNA_START=23 /DNA_END=535 /DNA_ORIENTATION=-